MVTCKNCGNMFVKCDAEALGMNLHTKIQTDNEILVTPEYYRIRDEGKNPKVGCECGHTELRFYCDYCGEAINAKTVYLVTEPNGNRLMSCARHAESVPEDFEVVRVKNSAINLIPSP